MKRCEFFQNGLQITHTRYNEFTATVSGIDRTKNELYVDLINNNGMKWQETWNLEHTESGIRTGEYTWKRTAKTPQQTAGK